MPRRRPILPAWLTSRRSNNGQPTRLGLVSLEDRLTPAAAFPEFLDPNPNPGNQFGASVTPLSTGNVVITSPGDDAGGTDAGAVYLFNGANGALISTLRGSTAGDLSGLFVQALPNGNYLLRNAKWDNGSAVDAGAVTFGNGTTGVSGVISAANSLVGSSPNDMVGSATSTTGSVAVLSNGNYVLTSQVWDNGATQDVGAVTFGNGTTGVSGVISAANSLIGASAGDKIGGNGGARALTNGNYVVRSPDWDNGAIPNAGAVTFGDGTTGVVGVVSAANSLVGSKAQDQVGWTLHSLTNGNYVVVSPDWDNGAIPNAGAVTFGNGTTGMVGVVSAANSLVGSSADDKIGNQTDSNNGMRSSTIQTLPNGNYLVRSPFWNNGSVVNAGAVTLGNGTTGTVGAVSAANSLVGSSASDQVGDFFAVILTNGNYVQPSPNWNNGAIVNAGAVTFGSGTTGVVGAVSAANSLVGSSANDFVGFAGGFNNAVLRLPNGNYVVNSMKWDNGGVVDAGAATFGSGTTGVVGVISAANSLVGSSANDQVGELVAVFDTSNYVVLSKNWDNGAIANVGAATFGDGTAGVTGVVSASNSLIGSTAQDQVGSAFARGLTNGNYLVVSPEWNNGAATDAGAVTFVNGTTGLVGVVSAANSLVGSTPGDRVGLGTNGSGPIPLTNGNYLVVSVNWDNGGIVDAGAVTFGNGTTGVVGAVSAANSLVGSSADDKVGDHFQFFLPELPNGNYVIVSPFWDNGGIADAGAVTFGNGTTGVVGVVSAANSLVGSSANDRIGDGDFPRSNFVLPNGNYLVRSPNWDNGGTIDAGIVTFVNGQTGAVGEVTSSTPNSVFGVSGFIVTDDVNNTFIVPLPHAGGGRVLVGSPVDGFLTDVNLSVSANAGIESEGTVITVTATARFPVVNDQTITVNVTGAGITAGDFALSNATITIPNGQTTGRVTFTVLDDSEVEPTERAILTLINPSANITLGTTITQSIAITNSNIGNLPPTISPIADQSSTGGVIGPIAFTLADDMTPVDELTVFAPTSSNPTLVPASNIVIAGTGANRTVTVTPVAGQFGQATITILVADIQLAVEETFVVTVSEPVSPPPPPPAANPFVAPALAAYGADVGGGPRIKAIRGDGTVLFDQFAFESTFTGGVRVATGDVNGDGTPDILAAAGDGGGPRVQVYDGKSGEKLRDFFAFEEGIRVGAYVASYDLNDDGFAEVIVSAGVGGGPRVSVFDGQTGERTQDFFAFDPADRGGVTVAAGARGILVGEANGSRARLFDATAKMTRELTTPFAGVGVASVPGGEAVGSLSGPPRIQVFDDTGLSHDLTPGSGTTGIRIASSEDASLLVGLNGRVRSLADFTGPGFSDAFQPFDASFLGGVWVAEG